MPKPALKNIFLAVLLVSATFSVGFSQTLKVLNIEPQNDDLFHYPIEQYLTVLPDPSGKLKIEDVISDKFSDKFKEDTHWLDAPVKTHWMRLMVKNDLPNDRQLLAYIQGSVIDFYQEDNDGQYSTIHSGLLVPIPERNQRNHFGHLPYTSVVIKKGALQTFYWRISTVNFPILSPHTNLKPSISSFEYILGKSRNQLFIFISVCSILFGLALYHFVISLITKDKAYLFFTILSLTSCFYIMYFKGYLLELIFPLNPSWHYGFVFAITASIFYLSLLGFVLQYVDAKKNFPGWESFLKIIFFSIVAIVIIITGYTDIKAMSTILIFVMLTPVILLEIFGFVLLQAKHPLGRNYIAAFSLLCFGLVLNGVLGGVGINPEILDFGDLGILGLQVLLAGGLALRINLVNKEKQEAQDALIKYLKEYQTLQQRATTDLEDKVSERTLEIEQQNEKLTRLNLLKDKLFSIISHDIKGPLNQLSSTLYMMERDMITKEEIKHLVPQIRSNLSTNANFINELLTWAKSQLEGARINPQEANLQELIESNFQLLKPLADAKEIQLTMNQSKPLSIYADIEMIKSVVRNLSSNAIKFTNPKGVVQINIGVDQSFASVSIEDNGNGISTENQKKLFGSQIFTTPGTANEKGTGIGLLLCKDFVEKNGGKIWVESEVGKGSKFAFTIPLNKN